MAYQAPDTDEVVEGIINGDEVEFTIDSLWDDQPLEKTGIFVVQDEDDNTRLVRVNSEDVWVAVDPDTLDDNEYEIYDEEVRTQIKTSNRI